MQIQIRYSFIWLFLLSMFSSVLAQGTWEKMEAPTDAYLHSVCFTDSLYGWAVGDGGAIIHTGDGGNTWTLQNSGTENNIMSVFFLNRDQGWATSFNFSSSPYGTVLLKTRNGGDTWTSEVYPEENIFINCILFLDSLKGWMGGSPHALLRTTDGGISWLQAGIDTSVLAFFPVLEIQFFDQNYGYACGGMFDIAGVIWRTSDGGDNWYAIDVSDAPADEVRGLHIFDTLNVMGAGGDPDFGYGVGLIRTTDGGQNWNYEELGFQGLAFDLDFRNDTEVWAPLGSRRKLIYSLNAGIDWTEIDSPDSTAIFDMTFPDSLHGYAVGYDGAVLRYHPPFNVGINSNKYTADHLFNLNSYPNPFSKSCTVEFKIPSLIIREIPVKLKILNVMGIEVANLIDRKMISGDYAARFDANGLTAGVYFCCLSIGDPGSDLISSEIIRIILME